MDIRYIYHIQNRNFIIKILSYIYINIEICKFYIGFDDKRMQVFFIEKPVY